MKNDRMQEKGAFQRVAITSIITLALLAMGIVATGLRRHEARAEIAAAARAVAAAAPVESAREATADDGSEMIGEAEPLLVGSPSPRNDKVPTTRR